MDKLLIVIVYVGLGLNVIPKIIKEKLYSEIWIVSAFLLIGLSISLLKAFGIAIPLPKLP